MKAMINNCISFMSALLAACCLPQQTLTKHTPVWSISPLTSTNIAYVVSLVTSQKLESGTEALIILLSCTLPRSILCLTLYKPHPFHNSTTSETNVSDSLCWDGAKTSWQLQWMLAIIRQ